MKKITTLQELIQILENGDYRYYGLRGATEENIEQAENNGFLDCSFDFDYEQGVPSDEKLDGTCALCVREGMPESLIKLMYRNSVENYCAAHGTNTVYLIGGDDSEWGADDDEIIIRQGCRGADVIAEVEI